MVRRLRFAVALAVLVLATGCGRALPTRPVATLPGDPAEPQAGAVTGHGDMGDAGGTAAPQRGPVKEVSW